MASCFLRNKGITLLEVAACVFIVAGILAIAIPNAIERIQNAQLMKTIDEMKSIAQSSIDYLESQGSCPTAISQLEPTYMTKVVASSPFGSSYQINCTNNMVSVSNLIPAGLAKENPEGPLLQATTSGSRDNVTLTETVPNAFVAKVLYENKYLYN